MPLSPPLLLVAYANTSRRFFQIRRPGLHATAPYPIVSIVRTIAPIILGILEYVWYEIVAYITASTPLATSMSLKPVDRPSTRARILVPFPLLPVSPYEHVICSKLLLLSLPSDNV